MSFHKLKIFCATLAVASSIILSYCDTVIAQSATGDQGHWVGSWGASPALPNGPEVTNQTIRQVIRLSLGGHAVESA